MAAAARLCNFRCKFKVPLRLLVSRTLCTDDSVKKNKNIPSFDSKEVRSILRKITGLNLDKIYSARKQELGVPSYKLMTDAEFLKVSFGHFFNLILKLATIPKHLYTRFVYINT